MLLELSIEQALLVVHADTFHKDFYGIEMYQTTIRLSSKFHIIYQGNLATSYIPLKLKEILLRYDPVLSHAESDSQAVEAWFRQNYHPGT